MRGRTISDADRARARRIMMDESGRTISDADRLRAMRKMSGSMMSDGDLRLMRRLLESSPSDSDTEASKKRMLEEMLNRNDGGMAMKTRVF